MKNRKEFKAIIKKLDELEAITKKPSKETLPEFVNNLFESLGMDDNAEVLVTLDDVITRILLDTKDGSSIVWDRIRAA